MTQLDMRTPLKKVRGLGSARGGTDHFWRQRLTAIANVPLTLIFVGAVIYAQGATYEEARGMLANPLIALLLSAAVLNVCYHMKLGMQIIIEDYIHGEPTRIIALMANILFCAAIALISVFSLLRLTFAA